MSRLKLNVIKPSKEFPGPTQTRIEADHIIDELFIGGIQLNYPELQVFI